MKPDKSIYIIGMPGSGKTRLGKALAKSLGLPFTDLDKMIESKTGKSIPELFSEIGEDHFRKLESVALLEYMNSGVNGICATGGGTPCFFNQMELMNQKGYTVYINMSADKLLKRLLLQGKKTRPMWSGLKEIDATKLLETLYSRRITVYEQAQVRVNLVDNYKIDLESLINAVKSI